MAIRAGDLDGKWLARFSDLARDDARVVAPGSAGASVLTARMRSRDPRVQMPPLATVVPDPEALALIERWINHDLQHHEDTKP